MTGVVKELLRKYDKARRRSGELEVYMEQIGKSIGQTHIRAWRAEEAAYLKAVVDIKQHKNLKNIYEPPAEACKPCSLSACGVELTHLQLSRRKISWSNWRLKKSRRRTGTESAALTRFKKLSHCKNLGKRAQHRTVRCG